VKTETLIEILARQAGPAPDFPVARRLAAAGGLGLLASSVLALALIGPLPAAVFYTAAPWVKLGFAVLLLIGASALAARLSRPVSSTAIPRAAVISVFLLMLLAGAVTLITTPEGERWSALLGHTWWICPWMLMMLSLPALTAILWSMRSLAPTRLKQAGFAAGLVAGVVGAMGYSLACPETSVAFVAVWYSIGIVLTGWVGQWLGPKVLRW
jgi:hypothetical protein